MHKAAVIGDYNSIYGFASLGLDIFPVDEIKDATVKFRKLADGEYAMIYITEEWADILSHEIERYKDRVTPAVILIPGIKGNTGEGVKGVKACVEQAIGSDIVFDK